MEPLCVDLFCGLGGWAEGFLAEGYRVVGFDIERHRYPKVFHLKDPESGHKQEGAALKLGEGRPRGAGFNVANEKAYSDALRQGFTEWNEYPAQLVLQDVFTLHGSQFRDAACIVASPPCQEFSYMAMPWKLAKAKAAAIRADGSGEAMRKLTALFDACFRIQREACEAAGRYIPMVVENVKGAQPWVGKAKANFGSFYLWGDVAMVGNRVVSSVPVFGRWTRPMKSGRKFNPDGTEHPQGSWFKIADSKERGARSAVKVSGLANGTFPGGGLAQGYIDQNAGRSLQSAAVESLIESGSGIKQSGISGKRANGKGSAWFEQGISHLSSGSQRSAVSLTKDDSRLVDGLKGLDGRSWIRDKSKDPRPSHGNSPARKAASAEIAKIPFELASYIARSYNTSTVN